MDRRALLQEVSNALAGVLITETALTPQSRQTISGSIARLERLDVALDLAGNLMKHADIKRHVAERAKAFVDD